MPPDGAAPRAAGRRRLPGTVVALGVVSLLTDLSSEMIVPLLPAFLVTIGASGAFIGLIDGLAETVAAFLKLASGVWADKVRRKPLVVAGYGLASLVRPLMAIATAPWHALVVRSTDRIGKGLRSSPRDALLAEAAPPGARGVAFGFHRAMDHAGALFGPLVAYALVSWLALGHRAVFALAAIPGLLAVVVLIVAVREPPRPAAPAPEPTHAPAPRVPLPRRFYAVMAAIALFTLGNATDFFLLLRAQELGVPVAAAPLLWALLHLVKSTLSTPLGALSDRIGRRAVIVAGWVLYAAVYVGFAAATAAWHAWALFAIYGVTFAFAEGSEKALVADLAPGAARGRAFGIYNFTVGICLLPASAGFGLVWDRAGHGAAFCVSAGLAVVAAVVLSSCRARASSAAPRCSA
jgi:MFS family permease